MQHRHTPLRPTLIALVFSILFSPLWAPNATGAPQPTAKATLKARPDPFKIDSKPPLRGYISRTAPPVEEDLLRAPMIAQMADVIGTIKPRSFSTLRRALSRTPIDPAAFTDSSLIGFLHMHRKDIHTTLQIHTLDETDLALRSTTSPEHTWRISKLAFKRLGINLTPNAPLPILPDAQSFELPKPYTQSRTILDRKTVRARIKHNYPPLTRSLNEETFRVRMPADYNPDFPAGVLVWISPSPDGRIPAVFEPIADKHGFIIIGIDNNGNKRQITDRLQNHFDSIETLASHFRIDRKRIYLTGVSGGGKCSSILLLAFPDLFAGAVPIVGLSTYHKAPTGDPGKYWPAGLGKPAGKWMNILKSRRIAAITGSIDFNQPEMSVRTTQLKRDGIDIRLDIIEGMGHTFPGADQFAEALDWADEPRRDTMVADFKLAKELLASYIADHTDSPPTTPAARNTLIKITTLAPWTEPSVHAAKLLGFE